MLVIASNKQTESRTAMPAYYTTKTIIQALGVTKSALNNARLNGAITPAGKIVVAGVKGITNYYTERDILNWLALRKQVSTSNVYNHSVVPTILGKGGYRNPAACYFINRTLMREAELSTEPSQQALNLGEEESS